MTTRDPRRPDVRRRRRLLAVGAVVAWGVTLVFVLVGDGVEPEGAGVSRVILAYAHQAVWLLLAVALTWAAVRGGWGRPSSILASLALVLYAAFLLALLGAGGS